MIRSRLVAALLVTALLGAGGCAEPERLEAPPLWLDALRCLVQAQQHLVDGEELDRAKALSLQAREAAGDQAAIAAYAELTSGAVERARGDLGAWIRHTKAALERVPTDAASTAMAMEVARAQASLGDLPGAQETLSGWRGRVTADGAAAELTLNIDRTESELDPAPEPEDDGGDPDDLYPIVLDD